MLAPIRQIMTGQPAPPLRDDAASRFAPSRAHPPRSRRYDARDSVKSLLDLAGVVVNGDAPTDIQVHNANLYARVIAHGSLGLGEAYMDGWWDADDLDGFLFRLLYARLDEQVATLDQAALFLRSKLVNLQRGRRAFAIGELHYDLGNDLFRAMLGKRLVYSCGYWREARNLDDAQEAKLDLVCRKLGLRPGMRVLDIGCGWGEALKFAAENYGVSGVGITVSREQAAFARDRCFGMPI
ncbi:MAG TPA: class I SAM-dependent methyltransferase, partial [Rudaea sp.]|nr:class I SAM-dependent methyltransferase [Rudaea sp.]